ncbi:small multidrug resistance pump [Prauserella shujinwangii]|uniref:Small multidrug resistance pump n=1 Tax=Prauserella shujinwangii TaxID=1453103 RepID=A0A2T0LUM0_9PSEU|nr:multidrug efflux SMR transporter [Prauserella shujinwangii]PRX47542.1 small multidrug resistance pump [Prauserella shujinwangii]
MVAYLLLAAAIVAEVTGTVALKLSDGFTKAVPSVVVAAGYGLAFFLMARVLKMGMPVGVVYAIWSAVGVALVALIGAMFLNEQLNLTMIAGLVLIIGGVTLLELGGAH